MLLLLLLLISVIDVSDVDVFCYICYWCCWCWCFLLKLLLMLMLFLLVLPLFYPLLSPPYIKPALFITSLFSLQTPPTSPCKYGDKCYQMSSDHRSKFSHSTPANGHKTSTAHLPDIFSGMCFYVPETAQKSKLLGRYIVAYPFVSYLWPVAVNSMSFRNALADDLTEKLLIKWDNRMFLFFMNLCVT